MEPIVIIGLSFLTIVLWFWAIIDIVKSRFKNQTMNTVWLLIVLFFPILGSIIYLLLRKKYTTKEVRKFQPNFKRAK
ncbi:MAG: PLD nuclease N-terminal domain-containing protein [Bacteroidales bacterium]|nr:PLD nuclease N-terminal domain-containing protein [Bacteroidales bacterium]